MTTNDTQLTLQPRELTPFQQFNESGKSHILLGNVLKDMKWIGINVTNIPIIITFTWYIHNIQLTHHILYIIYNEYHKIPRMRDNILPKDNIIWKWDTT